MKKLSKILLAAWLMAFVACNNDDEVVEPVAETPAQEETAAETPAEGEEGETMEEVATTSFNVTISNVVNFLEVQIFNQPDDVDGAPGPLPQRGGSYWADFQAVPGTKLNFATMQIVSNDFFFGPTGQGIELFDDNGQPVIGDVTDEVLLWDGAVEATDPSQFASVSGGNAPSEPDPDTRVRVVTPDVTDMIRVTLDYNESTRTFRLLIVNLRGSEDPDNPVILSPGILVLHALDNPLFTTGEPDRGLGLADISIAGNPTRLFEWFTETGTTGAPLRLSSSYTLFSPGVVYAFGSERDPVFVQGQPAVEGSGVEEIAEDGNNGPIFDYISNQLNIPVAASDQTSNIGPGESLTFTLEDVPVGYRFSYNTMMVNSNDWFLSYNNVGYPLFEEDGTPKSGTGASARSYLYDAGTEVDQIVGFGADQPMRQAGPNTGAADENNLTRRVTEIEDVQFGKGLIASPAGVVYYADPRGGYNMVVVTIEPIQ
ncbi:spondin domain-containing protein [Spongiimicrobium salis]|uniref:spondin domain-containing protein n=1 Tax=Spongiimicrobium salis TaxID=1667022 RepID=UPI00374CEB02